MRDMTIHHDYVDEDDDDADAEDYVDVDERC